MPTAGVATEPESPSVSAEETFPPSRRQLLTGFGKLSVVSVGGGTAAWARELFVVRDRWMTDDAFLEARALSQILPGPNMINFSIYVGSHYHGAPGAALAFVGLTAIPIVFVMTLGLLYMHSGVVPSAAAVLSGLAAAAVGSSFGTAFASGRKHFREPVFTALVAGVFICVGVLRWSMLKVTLAVAAISLFVYRPSAGHAPPAHAAREPHAPSAPEAP